MTAARQATGTVPPGTEDEEQAARWVQSMFTDVAPRYDLLNHLLSFNIDRLWRKALVRQLRAELTRRDAIILDLCCGTGDVLLDLQAAGECRVLGADFCHPMLVTARNKGHRRRFEASLIEADGLNLPLAANSLDGLSIAFGFRNFANYGAALVEIHRVLKPGGTLAILEFSHPRNFVLRAAYGFYSKLLMPAVGSIVSGSREAYTYLPDSIRRFPRAEALRVMIENAGFAQASFQLLTGGIAAVHTGRKR